MMAARTGHSRLWLFGLMLCISLMADDRQATWVPGAVRQQIPLRLPPGISFFSIGGPSANPAVRWIASARGDLYAETAQGLFRRDFSKELWQKAGVGLPNDQARGIAATNANFYALAYSGQIYHRTFADAPWLSQDLTVVPDKSAPSAPPLLAAIGEVAVVSTSQTTYCRRDAESGWREVLPRFRIFAFQSSRSVLYAFGRSKGLVVWMVDPRSCQFHELPPPPGRNFLGAAGWNFLSVLTESGLFRLQQGAWIPDKEVGPSTFIRSLIGAEDVMVLKMAAARWGDYEWHWKPDAPNVFWKPLRGGWQGAAAAKGIIFPRTSLKSMLSRLQAEGISSMSARVCHPLWRPSAPFAPAARNALKG